MLTERDLKLLRNEFETGSNGYADIGTTSTPVLAANADRCYAVLTNDSDTVIYLALGEDAVANSGPRLNAAGGSYEILKGNLFKGAINAIHGGTGAKRLTYSEGTP